MSSLSWFNIQTILTMKFIWLVLSYQTWIIPSNLRDTVLWSSTWIKKRKTRQHHSLKFECFYFINSSSLHKKESYFQAVLHLQKTNTSLNSWYDVWWEYFPYILLYHHNFIDTNISGNMAVIFTGQICPLPQKSCDQWLI